MTNSEFSNEFDVLYNNIMSNQAPGLDEYEKSVFLTKALNEILKNYFTPQGNLHQQGFDDSAKRLIDFSKVMRTKSESITADKGKSATVELPLDVLIHINETVTVDRDKVGSIDLVVVPLSYMEYSRLMSKPFKRPLKNQAWRIISGISSDTTPKTQATLIAGISDAITKHTTRYVKRPQAIVLTTLEGGVTLDGDTEVQPCELDESLHPEILQRAVELAKAAYTGGVQEIVELGKRSE